MLASLLANETRRATAIIARSPFETFCTLAFLGLMAFLLIKGVSWFSPGRSLAEPIGGFLAWLTLTGFLSGAVNDIVDDMDAGLLPHLFTAAYPVWLVVVVRTFLHGATGFVYGLTVMVPLAVICGIPLNLCLGGLTDLFVLALFAAGAGVMLAGLAFILPRSRVVTSLASFLLLPVVMFSGYFGAAILSDSTCSAATTPASTMLLIAALGICCNLAAIATCRRAIARAQAAGIKF